MNPLTIEWIDKAEGDLLTARREYRARKSPNYDAVCFHTQQAAEKSMKAVLQEHGMSIPRIHSLADLLALIAKNDVGFMIIQADTNVLVMPYSFVIPGYLPIKRMQRQRFRLQSEFAPSFGQSLVCKRIIEETASLSDFLAGQFLHNNRYL